MFTKEVYTIKIGIISVNTPLEGSEEFLKGPLSEETEAPDSVDGGHDSVTLDPERLEPRLDAEDTYVGIYIPRWR